MMTLNTYFTRCIFYTSSLKSLYKVIFVKVWQTPQNSISFPFQGFLAPGEIDPLNRRFSTILKPDVVVQGMCQICFNHLHFIPHAMYCMFDI